MSILILWSTGQALSEVVSAFLENADEAAEVLTHPPHNEDALSLSCLKTSQPTANRTFQQKSIFLQGYRMNFPHFFTCPYLWIRHGRLSLACHSITPALVPMTSLLTKTNGYLPIFISLNFWPQREKGKGPSRVGNTFPRLSLERAILEAEIKIFTWTDFVLLTTSHMQIQNVNYSSNQGN